MEKYTLIKNMSKKKNDLSFSDEMREIFNDANDFASAGRYKEISLEMVVYFLMKRYLNGSGTESTILKEVVIDLTPSDRSILERVLFNLAKKSGGKKDSFTLPDVYYNSDDIIMSDEINSIIHRIIKTKKLAKSFPIGSLVAKEEIGVDEFIHSILSDPELQVTDVLGQFGIDQEKYSDEVFNVLGSSLNEVLGQSEEKNTSDKNNKDDDDEDEEDVQSKISGEDDEFEKAGRHEAIQTKKVDPNSKTPELDKYAIDMTKEAKEGKYDPVVGRSKEIEEISEILCCRKKNNAILLGDPGTGKTSIIELLAQRIAQGQVPKELKDKRLFSLDLNALVAGCIYRGQYEERLQGIIKEVVGNKDIIVFIDEIHNLLGNGSSSGQGDGANILKPYLARGEFQCLGSTTTDEFRKIIEKDGALKRRFQPVFIDEPGIEETIDILKGLSKEYGKFHKVQYEDEVIKKCVEWSGKYINDRFFPDKAIGILDMASSLAKLNHPIKSDDELEELEARKRNLESDINILITEGEGDTDALENASAKLDEATEVEEKIKEIREKLENDPSLWTPVTIDDVSNVISKISGVPIDKILSSDMKKVKEMKKELEKKVIGQDKAIEELTVALQRNMLGLRDPNKPIASFLLVGPTGCGKTLISKMLAKEFFGSEKSLVSIACSEYMQDWAESKLLGSAPGYVGFSDSEPRLYVLKRKPYTVLLIDEIEKSSSNLYNIWLNMLEEGEITLSNGEKVSCRNTIIIFTGNVGTKSLELKGNGLGFGSRNEEDKRKMSEETVMKEVKKEFRPEFLNRLTKIIIFNSLGKDELDKIFDLEFDKLRIRYHESNGYDIKVTKELRDYIVSKCEPKYGARSLNRLLIENIDHPVCKALLDDEVDSEDKKEIEIDYQEETVKVKFT